MMITLRGVGHQFRNGREVLADVNLVIPGDRRIALLGAPTAGKSTILGLLAGNVMPQRGAIERRATVSFVAGFQGGFRVTQTGRQNIMFAARAYGADPFEVFEFVREVTGFGAALDLPMRQISLPNRISLSYVLTYALPFDIYLFDNVIGPVLSEIPDFSALCLQMYERRTAEAGAILATRNPYVAQKYCDCALVLRDRQLVFFEELHDGLAVFEHDLLAAESGEGDEDWARDATDDPLEFEI